MTIEVLPFGTKCNLDCEYCYQKHQRANPDNVIHYDSEKLIARMKTVKDVWTIFGGEPLLLPRPQLEELLKLAFETTKQSAIQSNGTLISDEHIELFTKYHTYVGLSIDGPGALNDARWIGSEEGTRKATKNTLIAVEKLAAKAKEFPHLMPSFIIQLHRFNMADDRWPIFKEWLVWLDNLGVKSAQFHLLDPDYNAGNLTISAEMQIARVLELWEFQDTLKNLRFQEFTDVLNLQRGKPAPTCVWHSCDPWNTRAVEGVNGDGTPTQCGRGGCNDGKDWTPARGSGVKSISRASGWEGNRFHERQLSLYVTPQDHGGCKDCQFWLTCQSHCPGSGLPSAADNEGDWRLRSSYCHVYKAMFGEAERRVVRVNETPVSLRPDRLQLESRLYGMWASGQEGQLQTLIAEIEGRLTNGYDTSGHGDLHGDHTDTVKPHHGDIPHGDSYQDHTDMSVK